MLKLHLSDKSQTANTEGIQGLSVHLCNGQTIIPTSLPLTPPPSLPQLIPSAQQSPGWVGGQSLPDEHGWQYLPSISLVSHGRKRPEVQLVRERGPFQAGINPLTGNKAERAITPPGSDRPMKAERFFFYFTARRVLRFSPRQRGLHQPQPARTHFRMMWREEKKVMTLFSKQWCHTHLVSLQRPRDETGDSHPPQERA